ncbi:TPA: abortive phage resistance protein [Candidatus Marinimicrobia bacterium]|nr:abortive phage resistance protein [Candidatus Neomarinimicrobiota bacterium]
MLENKELLRFYTEIQEDIKSSLLAEEEGANPEQIFTEIALNMLADAGETENSRVCYDEKISKRGIEHKINAYSLYENYETLDLFITIYNPYSAIETIPKPDAEKSLSRLSKFFNNALNKSYVNEIEESSEIFDLANTLYNVPEIKENLVRINAVLLTNGEYKGDVKTSQKVAGYPIFNRVVDINYLFNLSEKSRIPIEIDFQEMGIPLPCISSNIELKGYQSYLAIIPGSVLAYIYELYGLRLLEQNVRSFLQFSGKINRGIRNTILNEPHMFLAFNNGIATTAEEVRLVDLPGGNGKAVSFVKDFQIVNGGQTTAAIYHSWKKHKADITNIYVQMKLTTIKNPDQFSETVARISEYANTQNKISISDLSSNKKSLVQLEHLSRTVWAPPKTGESYQTRWFFERARGQYRNERIRQGFTPAKRKAFDFKNPRKQMFTKELLAKYVNSYGEVYKNRKLVIGPHIVVRGSQKNYSQFLLYNFPDKPDAIYFQDVVSKAIIFKTAEKVYGIKPNSIGDMRYITVPYSVAWLVNKLDYKLDLYSIWKEQNLSDNFQKLLYDLMFQINSFIKENAPGALYGEWAKKEECWNAVKEQSFNIKIENIKKYIKTKNDDSSRNPDEMGTDTRIIQEKLREIKELGADNWKTIYLWCKHNESISLFLTDISHNIGRKLRDSITLSSKEILAGSMLLEKIAKESDLLQSFYYNQDVKDM